MLVDANAYGGLLAVAFSIVLLGGNSQKPLLVGWVRTACLLSLSIGLLLTSSRSAWVGIAFISLYAGFRSPRLMLLIVLIAISGIGMIAFFLSSDSFEQFVTLSSRQNTIEERVEIINDAWDMFRYNPAFGAGLGSYFEEHGIIVHNSAMWFLVEFGVIGLLVFLGFMSSFIIKGVAAFQTAPSEHQSLIAGLIAAHLAMLGISLGIEATYQRHWWLVMSLLGASYTLAIRDTKNEKSNELR
jgi:O-antigen ligase